MEDFEPLSWATVRSRRVVCHPILP
jgi:hypothetical protein